MTAKETVLEHAPGWTEEQAERALRAAEGDQASQRDDRLRRHRAAMERAAAVRAGQTQLVDAAALIRESREELEQRGS